jgi:non-heme chloroperoxidase
MLQVAQTLPKEKFKVTYFESSDHVKLHFQDWGSGSPVVFTHAWALSSEQWTYQMPALLEAGLRCVAYDRRGHGRSERPAGGYQFDQLADDLAALIDRLDLHGVTLVGHSLGTREIVRYLTRHGPARVDRVVMVAPTTPFLLRTADNPDGWDRALVDANLAALRTNVPRWCADSNEAGPYFGSIARDTRGLVEWTTRLVVDTPLYVLLETARNQIITDMRADLPRITLPTLVVHGDEDASSPIGLTGRKTVRLMPNARLVVYQGAGHGLYASEHERLNADLLEFIQSGVMASRAA